MQEIWPAKEQRSHLSRYRPEKQPSVLLCITACMCKTELRNLQSLFGLREPAVCLVHSYLSLHNTLNNIASFIKDYFKRGFNSVVKPEPKQSV